MNNNNNSEYKWGTEELEEYMKIKNIKKEIISKIVDEKITGRMIPVILNLNNYKLERVTGVSDDSLDMVRKELFQKIMFGDQCGKSLYSNNVLILYI